MTPECDTHSKEESVLGYIRKINIAEEKNGQIVNINHVQHNILKIVVLVLSKIGINWFKEPILTDKEKKM